MIQGFSHVALSVRRLEVSLDFYVRMLRFKVTWRTQETAYLASGDAWLVLIESEEAVGLPPGDSGHVAFAVSAEVLPELETALQAGRVHYWRQETERSKSIYCFDPDKHKLELCATASLVDKS